ncbi:hypothetical protein AB2B38_010485 [Balneola sp. MJW-20]|uniref:hypothetical protein n=1 Tax=Gracilimonas aurantiaca TaxID=3234185 RepID=UPI003465E594
MNKFMKGSGSFLLGLTMLSVLIFSGCEEPGGIGGQFYESSKVQVDTVLINGFTVEQFNAYTGGTDAAAAALGGKVSDPVYGDFEAQTLVKPNANRQAAIDRIDDSFILKLRLTVDSTYQWGNADENFGYTIYENTQFWRGATLQSEDQVTYDEATPVATFNRLDLNNNFYEVELSEEYSDKFLEFYNDDSPENDSLWNFGEYGLSIVPDPSNNVVESFRFGQSDLIVIDAFADDTTQLILQDWGYLYENVNRPAYTDNTVLSNSLDDVYRINLTDAINNIEPDNIVKTELVFYEDTTQLVNTEGPLFRRPETVLLNAQFDLGEFPEIALQLDNAAFRGFKDDEEGSFRFDITFYANDVIYAGFQGEDFYIYPAFRGGNLTNTLLFNEQSGARSPRLIITSIVEE